MSKTTEHQTRDDTPPISTATRRIQVPSARPEAPLHPRQPLKAEHEHVHVGALRLGVVLCILIELMFFAGAFCAYAVMRDSRPEVFTYGHYFLNVETGALFIGMLLLSSFTAALAVRYAHLNRRKRLVDALAATMLFGAVAVGVLAVEHWGQAEQGLLPGRYFAPTTDVWKLDSFSKRNPEAAQYAASLSGNVSHRAARGTRSASPTPQPSRSAAYPLLEAGVLGKAAVSEHIPSRPRNAHVFFGIHALISTLLLLHLLVGLFLWGVLLLRIDREREQTSLGSVDYGALYWSLASVVGVFLFPVFYVFH